MPFQFRENWRHRTDTRTDGRDATLNAASLGGSHITAVSFGYSSTLVTTQKYCIKYKRACCCKESARCSMLLLILNNSSLRWSVCS